MLNSYRKVIVDKQNICLPEDETEYIEFMNKWYEEQRGKDEVEFDFSFIDNDDVTNLKCPECKRHLIASSY